MNKTEMISAMAEKMGTTKKDAEKALVAFQDVVTEELINGGEVKLVGFGTFDVRERAEHQGRNPQTSEPMTIPASKSVGFKVGKPFKDAVNS